MFTKTRNTWGVAPDVQNLGEIPPAVRQRPPRLKWVMCTVLRMQIIAGVDVVVVELSQSIIINH